MFDKGLGLDLRNEPQPPAPRQLIEAERMSAIGRMACSISHDMRHSLTAIYANAELLERHDRCASARAELLLEIQEAVLAMTERIDSLLQFSSNGWKDPLVHERVSFVVEKAVAAAKFHPEGRNVSITVGKFPPAEADIDARNLESAIYNLLLNACQAARRSTHVPEVKIHLTDVDERIYLTILDNGPGIPASVRRTLFDPFVTAGKPNGTGLGLTLARRIAEEHGGSVCLEESNRERTVFTLSLMKNRSLLLNELKNGRAASKPAAAMDLPAAHKESTTEIAAHGMSGGRKSSNQEVFMLLFTVTMKSNGSSNEKARLSRAIHAASIAAGYPEDDLFQRFLSLGPSDFRFDLHYPALPKPRTDQMLMIEVLVSSGTDTNRKKGLVAALVEKLGEAGIDPNDIMVFFLETDRASGSFGGGRFAPPVAFA
jgi:anti-sigma regulatory factor (Ser/Thr protein kinase)